MNFFSFSRTIQIRLCLQFVTTLATMSFAPYLIIFFSSKLGTIVTGFMFIGVIIASVIGSFTGGYLADRQGRKKVIIWSESVVCIGFLLVALVNSPWLSLPYVTFLLFLVINLFTGMAGPAYQALIIDESNAENRRSIYTFSYWFQNLAVAIGGMIGAFLFMDHHFYLFMAVGCLTFFSLVITIIFIKETYVVKSNNDNTTRKSSSIVNILRSYKEVLDHKHFAAFAFANLLIVSVEEQLTNFIGIRLSKDLAEPEQLLPFLSFKVDGINLLGILKTENTLLVVCLTVVVSYLMKKMRDRSVLLGGLVLYFIGFTVISFHSTPSVLLLAMFLATIGELMHIPVKQTLLANMVPDHARSTHMAVFGLVSIIGASTAGIFIIFSSFVPTYVVTSSFVVMGIITMFIFSKITKTEASIEDKTITLPVNT